MGNSRLHSQLFRVGHPSAFELCGAAYSVKLVAFAPFFGHLTANYLVEVVHKSAEIDFSAVLCAL